MDSGAPPGQLDEAQLRRFIASGYHVVRPEHLQGGVRSSLHEELYRDGLAFLEDVKAGAVCNGENVNSRVPGLRELLHAPAVAGALRSLLGPGYIMHPHTFLHGGSAFAGRDQDYHKDGILPWNGHAMRHHQPDHVLVLALR